MITHAAHMIPLNKTIYTSVTHRLNGTRTQSIIVEVFCRNKIEILSSNHSHFVE